MPHIEYWRAMPPPALLPISVILLHSIGNTQKISFIAFFCVFPILLNTIDGVRGIDPTLIDTARSYGIRRWERDPPHRPAGGAATDLGRHAQQPRAGRDHDGAVASTSRRTNGVGYVLLISKNTFQLAPMWAAIVLIGVLGYVLNVLFLLAERRLLAWHRGWRAATARVDT